MQTHRQRTGRLATLLLLTDGRFPAGGHAHSSGLEAAVGSGAVHDLLSLAAFLRGRLATAGLVAGAFAAAACAPGPIGVQANLDDRQAHVDSARDRLAELDHELDARTASPALRLASRRQGRALARAGKAVWPAPLFGLLPRHPDGPHHAITLGVVATAARLTPADAATAATYAAVSGPAGAAVRLLALDPYQVHALLADLADACDDVAAAASVYAERPPTELPADNAPLTDITAELHASWEVRLFAS
jgi:urease accessory protein